MKTTLILCALVTPAIAAPPVLVRVTPETLKELQARDPMIRLVKPAEGEAKTVRPAGESLVSQSTILHDGKHWTLVPRGALVHLPAALQSKVNARPVGRILPWAEFLGKNRDWLATCEVSFEQAAGDEAIPAERAREWAKAEKAVVAVHQQGPISVRVAESEPLTRR